MCSHPYLLLILQRVERYGAYRTVFSTASITLGAIKNIEMWEKIGLEKLYRDVTPLRGISWYCLKVLLSMT